MRLKIVMDGDLFINFIQFSLFYLLILENHYILSQFVIRDKQWWVSNF